MTLYLLGTDCCCCLSPNSSSPSPSQSLHTEFQAETFQKLLFTSTCRVDCPTLLPLISVLCSVSDHSLLLFNSLHKPMARGYRQSTRIRIAKFFKKKLRYHLLKTDTDQLTVNPTFYSHFSFSHILYM